MIFVAEITAAVDAIGTEETFYFSSGRGWATSASDTPAKTYISGGLMGCAYRREMFAEDGLFGRVRSSFGTVTLNNARGDLDSWKNYGFDGRRFVLRMAEEEGAAYPSGYTLVFEARMLRASVSMRSVEIVLRDRLAELDAPVCTSTLAGTGGLEGPSTLAGRTIPRAYGDTFLLPAVLLDISRNIWLVCENECSTIGQAARNAGVNVTVGSDYASTADLLATAPAAGQARFYVDGPTYVRFETAPTNVQVSPGSAYTMDGLSPTFANIAIEAGIAGATGSPVTPEIYVDDPRTTYLEVLAREARQRPCWFGFDRSMNFVAETITDPSGGSPVATLTQWDYMSIERSAPSGIDVPVWRVTTTGRKNYADRSGLASTATDYVRQEHYKFEAAEDTGVLLKHPSAKTINVESGGFTVGGAAEFLALHKEDRDMLTVTAKLTTDAATYDLGDVLTIKHPRFGFASGKKVMLVAVDLDMSRNRVQWSLWG